jgi:hypothetical protein
MATTKKDRSHNTKLTPEVREAFISMLGEIPNVTVISKLFGVHPSNVYRMREKDESFDNACREAMNQGYDLIEEEARRRAVDGVDEPVFFQGELVSTQKKYSDKLLLALLKAYKPKKFNPGAKISVGDGEKISMTFNIGGDE